MKIEQMSVPLTPSQQEAMDAADEKAVEKDGGKLKHAIKSVFGGSTDAMDMLREDAEREKFLNLVHEKYPSIQYNQIARSESEISADTKLYIGKLFPGIFSKDIENIYTNFPEELIEKNEISIGGQSADDLLDEFNKREKIFKYADGRVEVDTRAKGVLNNPYFKTKKEQEKINLVTINTKSLGYSKNSLDTSNEIFKKAKKLGLELCPPEVGPYIALNYNKFNTKDEPEKEQRYVLHIAMLPIRDSSDGLKRNCKFVVDKTEIGKIELSGVWDSLDEERGVDNTDFVFYLPKAGNIDQKSS